MPKKTPKRLQKALEHSAGVVRQIEAALPPPKQRREQRILTTWTDTEHAKVAAFAEERGEPLASAVRSLALAAIEAMGR